MTKNDIAIKLATRLDLAGFGIAAATHVIEALMEIASEAFVRDEAIFLRGFGTIKPVTRRARKARNINAGKEIILPPAKIIKFIPSKALDERLNP